MMSNVCDERKACRHTNLMTTSAFAAGSSKWDAMAVPVRFDPLKKGYAVANDEAICFLN